MKKLYSKYIKALFFTRRTYAIAAILMIAFIIAYVVPVLFLPLKFITIIFSALIIIDYIFLFSGKTKIKAERKLPVRFSNGDENEVAIYIKNNYNFKVYVQIIDELPVQFQIRDFNIETEILPKTSFSTIYSLRPVERGTYYFFDINILTRSPLQLVCRKITEPAEAMVKVYPAFLEMKKYELIAFSNNLQEAGNRKIRKIGNSMEFEQIREYVAGDDVRTINWKATARSTDLMVNHFSDERSQSVYCIIDKGRVMKMPFNGMTLLDYSINSAMMLSRIVLTKHDKAGLISFDHTGGQHIPADRRQGQFNLIVESLYNQQTEFKESSYEKLYGLIQRAIPHRSLMILYTNFESYSALKRQLPYIRAIAKRHLLMVVFFENTEIRELTDKPVEDIETLYIKTIAEKFNMEKRIIIKELRNYGIITLLTRPENLIINTLNKYLELKARQAI